MTQDHLSKLFAVFSGLTVVICLNTWLASQGAKAILRIPLLHDDRSAMCFFALILGSVLVILACAVGILHARRAAGPWHARVPRVWLDAFDTGSPEGRTFQATVVAITTLLPMAAFVHFGDILRDSYLCVLDTAQIKPVRDAWWIGFDTAGQIRLLASRPDICTKGIEVIPGWEFVALFVLVGFSVLATAAYIWSLLRPPTSRATAAGEPGA